MDTVRHHPTATGPEKRPIGRVELVAGKIGKACRFHFETGRGFFTATVKPSPRWDGAAGFSFWIQGDGSRSWGGIELIDASDYRLRYGYCFPIDSRQWRKITVAWRDLAPELPAGKPVDARSGYAPSRFGNLWFGKWYYWGEYPPHSFAVDQVQLELEIPGEPQEIENPPAGLTRSRARLEQKKKLTIVTLGDSLSDPRHWANRDQLWSRILARRIKEQHGCEVEVIPAAIGGTQLSQNLVLIPRWLAGHPHPDLVTVWFGYNDWDSGMRGPGYRRMLGFAADRIRRMTRNRSDILLMTTCPSLSRWESMEELAEAARGVARERATGLADISEVFHRAGKSPADRSSLFCSDGVHLGPGGHELVARAVAAALAGEAHGPAARKGGK